MPNVKANGIQIEYETFGDPSLSPLLLIIGLGGQLIEWHEDFCNGLAEKGNYVIRFDNRVASIRSLMLQFPCSAESGDAPTDNDEIESFFFELHVNSFSNPARRVLILSEVACEGAPPSIS